MPVMPFWTQVHAGSLKVGGAPPLLESSVCQCGLGGRIGVTVLPVPGAPPVGPEGVGGLAAFQEQQRQQAAQDAAAHALANHAKEQAGKLALLGLACAIGGLFFPPLELVAVVALEASEAYLVAGIAIDVAVAIDHPTQDNWVTVGGDVVAVALGYVVGKVVVGRMMSALARRFGPAAGEEVAAETAAETASVGAPKSEPVFESANTKPRGMPLTAAEVEAQFGKAGADLVNETQAEALRVGATQGAKQRGPVLSGVKDPMTGETHYGQNVKDLPDDLHPVLSERVTAHKTELANGRVNASEIDLSKAGQPGTHSEIMALDKAIKAREAVTGKPVTDAELSDFMLHNRSLVPKTLGEGVPPRCANCWHITKGVRVIGND